MQLNATFTPLTDTRVDPVSTRLSAVYVRLGKRSADWHKRIVALIVGVGK